MADKTSTTSGTESNEQTPDQFFTGEPAEDEDVPASHATKGMTVLGVTEASRIEDSAITLEKERRALERRIAKEK